MTLLPTADSTNNVDVWDSVTYLDASLFDDGKDRGVPADNGIGVSVSGQRSVKVAAICPTPPHHHL